MKIIIKIFFSVLFILPFYGFTQNTVPTQTNINNDNPLKTELDLAADKHVKSYFKDLKAVGVSIGITLKGKDYYYNYGQLENGKETLPNNKSIYEIGSITKTFTGILLAQAVLDKKINLEDDIRKYLTEDYPNLEYNGTPIKIVNLANHTSRITRIFPNNWERADYIPENPFVNYNKEMFYKGLHTMKMDTLPGVKYTYSNMGVSLLGTILESVYQDNYFSLVNKHILKPLQMESTTIDLSKADQKNIAQSHNEKGEVVPFWDIPALPAMGALRSNTSDMVKYIKANNTEKLSGIALSHQFTFEGEDGSLGLNWFFHTTKEGYRMYEHAGGTGGSRSSLEFFPELNSGFVILTNSLANRRNLEKDLSELIVRLSAKK
jgi:serine-type D-Ala-D-Ala carboxypeptidase/endopeptidase